MAVNSKLQLDQYGMFFIKITEIRKENYFHLNERVRKDKNLSFCVIIYIDDFNFLTIDKVLVVADFIKFLSHTFHYLNTRIIIILPKEDFEKEYYNKFTSFTLSVFTILLFSMFKSTIFANINIFQAIQEKVGTISHMFQFVKGSIKSSLNYEYANSVSDNLTLPSSSSVLSRDRDHRITKKP